jgi:hypothetical protein
MKVKIVEPGWAGFTGQFGVFDFVDGVSVEDIGRADAAQLAALVAIENAEDGTNPSDAQRLIDTYSGTVAPEGTKPADAPELPPEPGKVYTPDELAAAADKGGIKAVRAIADPLGIRGTSIAQLIGQILTMQGEKQKQAEQAAAVAASEAAAKQAESAGGSEPTL